MACRTLLLSGRGNARSLGKTSRERRIVEAQHRGFGRMTVVVLAFAAAPMLAGPAQAGVEVVDTENIKLEVGLRMQARLDLERVPSTVSSKEWLHDFFIRRTRLKVKGEAHEVDFNFEWKIDRTDGYAASPSASVENAYMQYPLGKGTKIRAGLYDQPFSRDRLTSDSKQLAVDRGTVSNVPDALGLADNAVGFDFRGTMGTKRAEYALGMFDNRTISSNLQGTPMFVGRVDLNLGRTTDVFRDAHFGKDSWYSLGLNGGYQGSIENAAGQREGSNAIAGVDGMVDVPVGSTRLFGRGEANVIKVVAPAGGNPVDTRTWMLAAGVSLFKQRLQPMVRFDEVQLDDAAGGGVKDITYVGANFYHREHLLKFQGDVRLESGTHHGVDGGRLQAQLDF